jgi:thiamine-monophosphate kinase
VKRIEPAKTSHRIGSILTGVLGEFDLIGLLRERMAAAGAVVGDHVIVGSGDDAAVVEPRGRSVTSVDALVEGVHFERSTFPPDAIGHKALAVALSDLAAMGAQPGEAYVQLGVSEDISEDDLCSIADGLGAVAHDYGVSVVGGDVVASPVVFLAVTVVGYLPEAAPHVTRSGAEEGDVLILTGPVGGAAAGLLLLQDEALASGLEPTIADALRERQLRPQALTHAGLALARSGARAMIDVSDGLGADAGHLASASGVRCVVELSERMIAPGVSDLAESAGKDPLALAGGGEDYELLAAVPPERAEEALRAVRRTASDPALAGRVEAGEGVVLGGPTGREVSADGFDQIRSRARDEPT